MFPVLSMQLGSLSVHVFGLILALGALLSLVLLYQSEKRMNIRQGSAPGLFICAGIIGFTMSRLIYALLNASRLFYDAMDGSYLGLSPLLRIADGGHSVYGFILGASLGIYLFSLLTAQEKGRVFDWAAVPLGGFLTASFLAQIAGSSGYGEEVAPFLRFMPMAVRNLYGEWDAAVFFYEGLWALALTLWLKHSKRRPGRSGDRMLWLLIPLTSLQIFFESLRQDDYPRLESNAFIRMNQVLGLIVLLVILVLIFKRLSVRHKANCLLVLLLSAVSFIAAEFWEKLPVPKEALYIVSFVMALVLSFTWLKALVKADV